MTIKNLEERINNANTSYRKGESIMTDTQYDTLLEELEVLDPDNELLSKVGFDIDDSRKDALPIHMASMNKVKTIDEVHKWFKSKRIPLDTKLILTPKFDGASLCVEEWEKKAWTRGNGIEGQRSESHMKMMGYEFNDMYPELNKGLVTFGEAIMKRKTFIDKYSDEYSNPRNLVAGQFNHKTPNEILKDVDYLSFGVFDYGSHFTYSDKKTQLDWLNENVNQNKVEYKEVTLSDLSEEYLGELFSEWNKDYEIDGVIIEVNDHKLREILGRETSSGNPCFARAYKGDFEEVKETTILDIVYEISKKGLLKPVAKIKPIVLDGATVQNVTLNNAKFVKELDLGVGSVITVKRSGMVIPKLVSVVSTTGFKLPLIPGCDIEWNENGVELITKSITDDQRLKQLISFFKILEVDNMGEGTCKQFFENGFDTPEKVLRMNKNEMLKLDRFGERKAQKLIDSINDKKNVSLSKLQHASGFFNNLGSKKLLLLENLDEKSTISEISKIDGFSDISATNYLNGIALYNEWVKNFNGLLNISKTETNLTNSSDDLSGKAFVFTGVRRKDLEEIIINKGGRVASGVSSKTTHLVMKVKGSGSSKEKKALSLGQIILTIEELEELLNS